MFLLRLLKTRTCNIQVPVQRMVHATVKQRKVSHITRSQPSKVSEHAQTGLETEKRENKSKQTTGYFYGVFHWALNMLNKLSIPKQKKESPAVTTNPKIKVS